MTIGPIELERPLALLLLALPIALLLLVRLRARPEEDATGTLEIWRRAALERPNSAARSRRRIPFAIWLLCASLACAALAIAGPRPAQTKTNMLLVVVDRSPSMYLVDSGRTRLDRALDLASRWIEGRPTGSVRWLSPPAVPIPWNADGEFKPFRLDSDPLVREKVPDSWRESPFDVREAPDFSSYDQPDCLWITDRVPSPLPLHAGFASSGGVAVPGAVGVHEGKLVTWDGTRVAPSEQPAPIRTVRVGSEIPEAIARVAQAWALARGLVVDGGVGEESSLRIMGRSHTDDSKPEIAVGRDGWKARVTVGGDANPAILELGSRRAPFATLPCEAWLTDVAGAHSLVSFRAGFISLALTSLDRIEGDPTAFAVSWARLFDQSVMQPNGCISLEERQAAGETASKGPETGLGGTPSSAPWTMTASVVALVMALAAMAARSAPRRSNAVASTGVAANGSATAVEAVR